MGADAVTVQAHSDLGAVSDEMFQDGQVLAGEIRESIDIKNVLAGIIPLLQLFQQPGHLEIGRAHV